MTLRLFGHDVEITGGFLVSVLLLTFTGTKATLQGFVAWLFILFVSVLVHEFGHATAFRVFGVHSSIRLHFMGGVTIPTIVLPLPRWQQILVSFAGPAAGFLLALVAYLIGRYVPLAPHSEGLVSQLLLANIFWSAFNLIPVLPLDGGHILESALGPKRVEATLLISTALGALMALYFGSRGVFFATYIFGASAVQTFFHWRRLRESVQASRTGFAAAKARASEPEAATRQALATLEAHVTAERFPEAIGLGDILLKNIGPGGRGFDAALQLLGRAHFGAGNMDEAARIAVTLSGRNAGDPAFLGSVALASNEPVKAKNILEAARSTGDHRKEIFGPLIQIYLGENNGPKAAGLVSQYADQISIEDLRQIASLLEEGGQKESALSVYEVAFKTDRKPGDAFDAARLYAETGNPRRAIESLRAAISFGFVDFHKIREVPALLAIEELHEVLPEGA